MAFAIGECQRRWSNACASGCCWATPSLTIRRLLEPLASTDRDDELDAITSLEADLPEMAGGTPGPLRRRLKGLLGALDPVVKIIGGVATLEEIVRHL